MCVCVCDLPDYIDEPLQEIIETCVGAHRPRSVGGGRLVTRHEECVDDLIVYGGLFTLENTLHPDVSESPRPLSISESKSQNEVISRKPIIVVVNRLNLAAGKDSFTSQSKGGVEVSLLRGESKRK